MMMLKVNCNAYTLHNVARYVLRTLNVDINNVVLKIYGHFSIAAKRRAILKDFDSFTATEILEILHHLSTRWLSLLPCTDSVFYILEQPGPSLADAGPNASPGRGAPLRSDFYDVIAFSQPCYDRGRAQIYSKKLTRELSTLCLRSRGTSLVLTRAFFVNNEILKAFLANSQAQGVSGKNEQSTQTPWRGAPEARGPMQLHWLHWLKAGPVNSLFCNFQVDQPIAPNN